MFVETAMSSWWDKDPLEKGKQPPKEEWQSWKEWREELPLFDIHEDSGWQQWWNRQGSTWGTGTTSVKRKERRAWLQQTAGSSTDVPLGKGAASKTSDVPLQKGSASSSSDVPLQKGSTSSSSDVPLQKGGSQEGLSGSSSSSVWSLVLKENPEASQLQPSLAKEEDPGVKTEDEVDWGADEGHFSPKDAPSPDKASEEPEEHKKRKALAKGKDTSPGDQPNTMPFGVNSIALPQEQEPLEKGKQPTQQNRIYKLDKPRYGAGLERVPLKVSLTSSSDSESSVEPPPAVKAKSMPAASAFENKQFQEAYEKRKQELGDLGKGKGKKGKNKLNDEDFPPLGKGKGTAPLEKGNDLSYFTNQGMPRAYLDQWLAQGPLTWEWPFPEANPRMVGIDWHNTLQLGYGDHVPEYNKFALEQLLEKGYKVVLLSFCGARRAQDFLRHAWRLQCAEQLSLIEWCSFKTGILGKTFIFKSHGVSHVFDDNRSICEEALGKGMTVYPIQTSYETHLWFQKTSGKRAFRTFAAAVTDFLQNEEL